jgi:uncharacterized protein
MKAEAQELVNAHQLQPHPEGGFFVQQHESAHSFFAGERYKDDGETPEGESDKRLALTHIYYLLCKSDFSGWHKIKSEELWTFYSGCTLLLHILDPNTLEKNTIMLSNSPQNGALTYLIPRDHWFSAEITDKENGHSFVGCTVAPGFDFRDWTMAKEEDLAQYVNQDNQHDIERLIREPEKLSV